MIVFYLLKQGSEVIEISEVNLSINLNIDETRLYMFINKTEEIKKRDLNKYFEKKQSAYTVCTYDQNLVITNLDSLNSRKESDCNNLGYINLYLIKHLEELNEVYVHNIQDIDICLFLQKFMNEGIILFKTMVMSMRVNAITCFSIEQLKIINHPKKNQADLIMCVSGNCVKFL